VSFDLTQKLGWFEALAGYRVYDKPGGLFGTPAAVEKRTFAVDLMGGLTYSWLDVRLKVSRDPGGVFPPGGRTINLDNDWVAPYLGFRFTNDFTDHLRHETLLGVGAFGVGDAPNVSWQVTSLFSYAVSEHVALSAGYRALGFRDPNLKATFHGPIIGLAFRFSGGV
jgi:opacity protein-like surface antigen